MATGTVKWFNDAKGFGFIAQEGGGEDVFCHHTAIQAEGFRTLAEGQRVEFDVARGPKGLQVSNARVVGGSGKHPDPIVVDPNEIARQLTTVLRASSLGSTLKSTPFGEKVAFELYIDDTGLKVKPAMITEGHQPSLAEDLAYLSVREKFVTRPEMSFIGLPDNRVHSVFISYVREDSEIVSRFATALRSAGLNIWLDKDSIRPGERWQRAIENAIADGSFFIACFSDQYVKKTKSYMNAELSIAIEQIRLRRSDQVWFIPVILSDVEVPDTKIGPGETLRDLQRIELYKDWDGAILKILETIKLHSPLHRHSLTS